MQSDKVKIVKQEDKGSPSIVSSFQNYNKFNLTIPSLMHGELLLGYFGRLSRQNGFNDYLLAKKFINNLFIDKSSKYNHYPLALQMSDLLNIEPDMLARKHTLTPILRSITYKNIPTWDQKILQSQGCCLAKENVYFCAECVAEDMDYHGFSFWRVFHQIHGVDYCSKHTSQLLIANIEHAAFKSPDSVLRNKSFDLTRIPKNDYENPIIQNYIQLLEDHNNYQSIINFKPLLKYLNFRRDLKNLNLSTSNNQVISDLIFNQTPKTWLLKYFPVFNKKINGQIIRCIDLAHAKGRSPSLMNLLLMLTNICPEMGYDELINFKPNGSTLADHSFKSKKIDDWVLFTKRIRKDINWSFADSDLDETSVNCANDICETFAAFTDFLAGSSLTSIIQRRKVDLSKFESLLRANFNKRLTL